MKNWVNQKTIGYDLFFRENEKFKDMQKESSQHLQLGLFVLIGIILLMGMLFYVATQRNLFGSVFRVRALFSNVSGLKVGNNVRLGGLQAGTVNNIWMVSDTSVEVEMLIRKGFRKFIKKDAIVSIITDGLMGDKLVEIAPGNSQSQEIEENGTLPSSKPVETEQILTSLKASADNAELITHQLAEFAYKVNNGHGVLNRLIGDSSFSNNLNRTVVNLKKGSQGLSEDVEAAKHNFLLRGYFKKKKKEQEKNQADMKTKQNN
jgi:phospholipid/cholesterol/gamma-HCH transport system substrate-binding protein